MGIIGEWLRGPAEDVEEFQKDMIAVDQSSLRGPAPPEKNTITRLIGEKSEIEKSMNDTARRADQGQKQYWYGDNFVWALNESNADRKAKKRGYEV